MPPTTEMTGVSLEVSPVGGVRKDSVRIVQGDRTVVELEGRRACGIEDSAHAYVVRVLNRATSISLLAVCN